MTQAAAHQTRMLRIVERLQEFSLPLILGVVAALIAANIDAEFYHSLVHTPATHVFAGAEAGHAAADAHEGWSYYLTMHFIVNDLFMVLFFGVATKEITEACLPGGSLNPVRKAISPLIGTIGGVLGPVGVFFAANAVFGTEQWARGWGIPTATDIALAWLVARTIFGKGHPAVSFLLLLAVADDAIGLGIIAFGYPDPNHPTVWSNLLWVVPGLMAAGVFRYRKVMSWVPYIAIGGAFSWWGLYSAGLHPALALVFIVPFLPGPKRDFGLFLDPVVDDEQQNVEHHGHSPLERFEHDIKLFVDFGLFFFAFANAGVPFSGVNGLTWLVVGSLLFGKVIGISCSCLFARRIGFPLPQGMSAGDLFVTSVVAALGLTVALFVSGQAFADGALQGAAKMGAVFSGGVALLAFAAARALRIRKA